MNRPLDKPLTDDRRQPMHRLHNIASAQPALDDLILGGLDDVVQTYGFRPSTPAATESEYIKRLNDINHISFCAYELYRNCLRDGVLKEPCQGLKCHHRSQITSVKDLILRNAGQVESPQGFSSYELTSLAVKAFEFIPSKNKLKAIRSVCGRMERQIVKKFEYAMTIAPHRDVVTLRSLVILSQSAASQWQDQQSHQSHQSNSSGSGED